MDRGQYRRMLSATAGFHTDFHFVKAPPAIMACDGAAVYGSRDGSNFGKMAAVPAKDVAWTNGVYAAIGDSGVSASYDGFEWWQTSTSAFDMIAGGDGCFMAVSAEALYYNTNPANDGTWTIFFDLAGSGTGEIAYGCGQFTVDFKHLDNVIDYDVYKTYFQTNTFNVTETGKIPVELNYSDVVQQAGYYENQTGLIRGKFQSYAHYIYNDNNNQVSIQVIDSSSPGQVSLLGSALLTGNGGISILSVLGSTYLPGVGYCALGSSNRGFDSCVYDEQTSSVSFAQVPMS